MTSPICEVVLALGVYSISIIADPQATKSLIKGICNNYFEKLSVQEKANLIRLSDVLKERNEYSSKDGKFIHGTLSKDGIFPKTGRWDRDFLVKQEDKKYKVTHLDDICYNPANLKFGVICRNTFGDLIFSPIYVTFEVCKNVNIGFMELYLTNHNFIEKVAHPTNPVE